jgi:hypothetical protein
LTLSGVLKDILLVILSVIIWSTPVTALQMFGYAIALGGLIWYKIGGEQAQAAYMKLTGDENSTFNRFRRSLWAKIGAGLLVIFVFLAVVHGFSRGRGIDTASTKTGLTGVPDPEMVDAYHGDVSTEGQSWDDTLPTTHYTTEVTPSHALDIVIYSPPSSSSNNSLGAFSDIFAAQSIATLNPHVIAYAEEQIDVAVTQWMPLSKITSASAAYLHYLSNHYDSLAAHTIFLHTDVDTQQIHSLISSRFLSRTGVAELSQNGYSTCTCLDCTDLSDPTHPHLSKTDELYALTNQNICSASQRLLVLPLNT